MPGQDLRPTSNMSRETKVGESPANQETAITVTGLKPSHFYNVRVIAVGANSFQAGSRTVRLRTFGRDGRPQLGNSRLPPNFEPDDHQPVSTQREQGDENGAPRSPVPGIETASIPDGGPTLTREPSGAAGVPRRNTVGRRSSPSIGSMDQKPARKDSTSEAEIRELGEKFSSTKKELEDTVALIAKEEEDSKRLLDELEQEKQQKKAEQKKKEEQTEKLKKDVGTTERAMRSALQRKAQLEKEVKAKQAERSRYEDATAKMTRQIQEMRREREGYEEQKKTIQDESETKNRDLRESNEKMQTECSQLEADLKGKREQVKMLEDARKQLPGGGDDAEWRERDNERRREWQRKLQEWNMRIVQEDRKGRDLDASLNVIQAQLASIQPVYANYNQANSIGVDFDDASQAQLKRRSRHSNSISNVGMSPAPHFVALEPPQLPTGFGATRPPPGFAQGPFLDMVAAHEGMEDDMRAPLSPSATALLPSNIFTDDEHDEHDDLDSPGSNLEPTSPFAPMHTASPDHVPQSPDSGRSASLLSSPRGSSQNLPFPPFPSDDAERQSLHPHTGSFSPLPVPGHPATNRLTNLFSLQRGKPAKRPDEPPELGSLKPGQSQSFPRQQDEIDGVSGRRRISLSNVFNRNSVGPDTMDTYAPQNGTRGFSARSLFPFGSRAMTGVFDRTGAYDHDQISPRPASIASAELPRPSTDSATLWPPQDQSGFPRPRHVWSPADNNAWSRNPSRRPSIHGSPSALKTTLASADDAILDEEDLLDPQVSPSQVGVIGRGPVKKSLAKALNPAAPSFMGGIFKPKSDKDGSKDKAKSKEKGKAKGSPEEQPPQSSGNDSNAEQSESRLSMSVQSRTSVCESHDSLSLDQSFSNTPSDLAASITTTSPDNVVRKLFRKGSSSKFSLSSRLGGSKKAGPGSTTTSNSEREHRSSFGGSDVDILGGTNLPLAGGEDLLGKSFDSTTSSPSGVATKTKDGRMSGRFLFSMGKKKGRESLEHEQDPMGSGDVEALTTE